MSFIINQNFDLKSPQFNFARDYFKDIAALKTYCGGDWNNANYSSFPDNFITNVGGTLYQYKSGNSVDNTTGKWRKLLFGSDLGISNYLTKYEAGNNYLHSKWFSGVLWTSPTEIDNNTKVTDYDKIWYDSPHKQFIAYNSTTKKYYYNWDTISQYNSNYGIADTTKRTAYDGLYHISTKNYTSVIGAANFYIIKPIANICYSFILSNNVTTSATKDSSQVITSGGVYKALEGKANNSTVNDLKSTVDTLSTTVSGHTTSIGSINTTLANKVDKVTGKGLSTNDFSNDYKDRLDSIEKGANKTVVDTTLSNSSTNPVQNKVIYSKFRNMDSSITNLNNNKLDSSTFNDFVEIALTLLPFYGFVSSVTVDSNISSLTGAQGIFYDIEKKYFVAKENDKYYTHWTTGYNYNNYSGLGSSEVISAISNLYKNINTNTLTKIDLNASPNIKAIVDSNNQSYTSYTFEKSDININLALPYLNYTGDVKTYRTAFPMASDSQAGAITSAQFNAFTAATKAATTGANGLMIASDKAKLDRLSDLKQITISQLDKCGYTSEANLVNDVAKYGELKFYVTDAAAVVTCTTDAAKHAIFQTITTHNTLNTSTFAINANVHQDGVLYTYQRYYAFSGGTYATANLNKWSYWYILDINGYAPTAHPTSAQIYKNSYTQVLKDASISVDNSTNKITLVVRKLNTSGAEVSSAATIEFATTDDINNIF